MWNIRLLHCQSTVKCTLIALIDWWLNFETISHFCSSSVSGMHTFFKIYLILAISPWEIVSQAPLDDVEYWGKTLTKSNPKACCNQRDQSKGSRIAVSSPLLGVSLQNSE